MKRRRKNDINAPGLVNEIKDFLRINMKRATPYDIMINFLFSNFDLFTQTSTSSGKYADYAASFSNNTLIKLFDINNVEDLYMCLYYIYEKNNSMFYTYFIGEYITAASHIFFSIYQIYNDRVEFRINHAIFKIICSEVTQTHNEYNMTIWSLKMPEGFAIYETCKYSNVNKNLYDEWIQFKKNKNIQDFYSNIIFHLDELIKKRDLSNKLQKDYRIKKVDSKTSEDKTNKIIIKHQVETNNGYIISKRQNENDMIGSFWNNNKMEHLTNKEKGDAFVDYCIKFLTYIGFNNIYKTTDSHDFGADLLATRNGLSYAIQCKNCDKKIGTKAVSEVNTSRDVYNTTCALVLAKDASEKTKIFANTLHVDVWVENDIEKIKLQVKKMKNKTLYNPKF